MKSPRLTTTLRIGHVDTNRLATHFNELEVHCNSHTFDLLAITDTISTEIFNLSGMNFCENNRAGKAGETSAFTLDRISPSLNSASRISLTLLTSSL